MHLSHSLVAIALVIAAGAATARDRPYDAKALARYDSSYAQCESRFADMAGHKDEAYFALWRIKADARSTAKLAQARADAEYKAERKRLGQSPTKAAPAASSPLERECRALWAEYGRATPVKR